MKSWVWITLIMTVLTLLILLLFGYSLSRCAFTCKKCGRTFQIRWRRAIFLQHVNRDYILRCPACGQKGWCHAEPPKKKTG